MARLASGLLERLRGSAGRLLVVTALVLAGCGLGSGDPTPPTTVAVDPDTPLRGGQVVYAVQSDTGTPWTPARSALCTASCHVVMRAVFDPLTILAADGSVRPYLLESIQPNADRTAWTLVPRTGVMFHDGTAFDAAAIAANLEEQRASFVNGAVLRDVTSVSVSEDGSSVVVQLRHPWVRFPSVLTGQVGYMASPRWLAEAAADLGAEARPVGTGPFRFESYEPGRSFVATRNPDYWRASEGLPRLDRIEFRFITDPETRVGALFAGGVDMLHSSNAASIRVLRLDPTLSLTETSAVTETDHLVLRVDDPTSPLNDVRIRRALAMATDRAGLLGRRGGVGRVANGPFAPGEIGHLDNTGYPAFDPAGAAALVAEYAAEHGGGPVALSFTTTADAHNLYTAERLRDAWQQIGITVEVREIAASAFQTMALTGDFQIFAWRNHGGIDPGAERIWWHTEAAVAPPGPALNFGRIRDAEIDRQLDVLRSTEDPEARRLAAEAVNRRFGSQVYDLWLSWPVWAFAARPGIAGLHDFALPDGTAGLPGNGIAGFQEVSHLWRQDRPG